MQMDFWAGCKENGLIGLKFDNNNVMQITTPSIIPNSPKRNYNFYMNIEKMETYSLQVEGWLETD